MSLYSIFFFQAEDGIRDYKVTGVQTCALPILDNTPPVITISGVAAGQYAAAVTPVIGITDLALLGSSITLNGSAYASGTPVAANCDYTLRVEAVDKAGNGGPAPPPISILLPPAHTPPPAV